MKIPDNKQVVPGFTASALSIGLKKDKALDLGLIFSEQEAIIAGVFTTNKVQAAPIILTRQHIKNHKGHAIIVNAGNANACTGARGLDDAYKTSSLVANLLNIHPEEVMVASTGVIGQPLDMPLIENALPDLIKNLSKTSIPRVAKAILTTDSFSKLSVRKGYIDEKPYQITGIAKGAGMIMPNMATMLCFVLTDIRIENEQINAALQAAVETTFNRITVDGDTSTNDMVLVMANGMAENRLLTKEHLDSFTKSLEEVMGELAQMIIQDGEGATKVIRIEVKGALTPADAIQAARTVANSSLVKTAFYGQDPNWGRIMAALGRSGVTMDESTVDIWIDDIRIVLHGLGVGPEEEKKAAVRMGQKEFSLLIKLNQGRFQEQILTCDLTHEYININADYRT